MLERHFGNETAGHGVDHLAAFFAALAPTHHQTALCAGDAHIHQAPFFLDAGQVERVLLQADAVFFRLERQQAFVDTSQHHVRPLQALGRVQGGQGDHVLVFLALAQGRQQRNGLRDFEQRFAFAHQTDPGGIVNLTTATLGHPVDKIQHVRPASRRQFFAVFAVVQMFFVIDVFQPLQQQCQCGFAALRVLGAVLQIVDLVTKGLQTAYRFGWQCRAQRMAEHRLEHADAVKRSEFAQLLQRGVTDAAFGRGDATQKRRVVIVVYPQAQPSAQVAYFCAVKKTLTARHFVRNSCFAKRFFQRS